MNEPYSFLYSLLAQYQPEEAFQIAQQIAATLPYSDDFMVGLPFGYAFHKCNVAPVVDKPRSTGTVYCIRSQENGTIKIGFTDFGPAKRYKVHTKTKQCEVEPVFECAGCYADETALHYLFAPYRDRSETEWYRPIGNMPYAIEAMRNKKVANPLVTASELLNEAKWALYFYPQQIAHYQTLLLERPALQITNKRSKSTK